MKKLLCMCIVLISVSALTACEGKKDAVDVVSQPGVQETAGPTPTPEPTEDLTGKAVNSLTGLYIDEEAAMRRPIAVVINNLHRAKPQSGISQADIITEVLAEGEITRLVAVFRDFEADKIGPVRSARDYFLDFAADYDAVFVHHGGSPQAYNEISSRGANNLDGMREASTFWRDPKRANVPGMYEHSSYTSAENILSALENRNYRVDAHEDADTPFDFPLMAMTPQDGVKADIITVPYSHAYTRRFEYNEESGVYAVFQGGEPHIDELTGEQLTVSNVLVQYVNMYVIAGDEAGRRVVDVVGKGDGVLCTDGVMAPVTWVKTSHGAPTQWFSSDGRKLMINKGKTWINVFMGDISTEILPEEATDETEGGETLP